MLHRRQDRLLLLVGVRGLLVREEEGGRMLRLG